MCRGMVLALRFASQSLAVRSSSSSNSSVNARFEAKALTNGPSLLAKTRAVEVRGIRGRNRYAVMVAGNRTREIDY